MFSFLKFFSFGSGSDSREQHTVAQVEHRHPSMNHEQDDTLVHVWRTSKDTVGHVAIQVGPVYASLHPGHCPAVGPASVLPLPASFANSLTEDMETEAMSQDRRVVTEVGSFPEAQSRDTHSRIPPDETFRIKNLDTAAMQAEIARSVEQVNDGSLAYQLLPRVNVLGLFGDSANFHESNPPSENRTSVQTENCATYVGQVLTAGGLPVEESVIWGVSPNGLANHLDALSSNSQNSPSTEEADTGATDESNAYQSMSCF